MKRNQLKKTLAAAIAETYQKYFIDREVSAGVPFILYNTETGRVFGQPSALPLRDSDIFITKLTENCFGDNVSSAADIEYFLTKVSPEWLDNMTDALETAERQNQADADNLTAVLEARYNAESVYIEKISDLMDENQALKEKLSAIQAITNPDQTQG